MKLNMGIVDRLIRVIIAVVIGVLYYNSAITGTFGIIMMILAVIFLLTSFIGSCPLYMPFNLSTKSKKGAS